jgi:hypothetical protein
MQPIKDIDHQYYEQRARHLRSAAMRCLFKQGFAVLGSLHLRFTRDSAGIEPGVNQKTKTNCAGAK